MNKHRMALGSGLTLIAGLASAWVALAQSGALTPASPGAVPAHTTVDVVPGMPPVVDPANLYRETGANQFSPAVNNALARVYVPNRAANTVSVIDPATLKVVDTFKVGVHPQHVVPSWDLRTLWVANNAEGRTDGSLTPIDPQTGKPGKTIAVDDPYNMYWTPDGKYAIVVAEAYKRLDFRDVATMQVQYAIQTPGCAGITMPTSRSMGGMRCSPASSMAASPRSIWSTARCWPPSSSVRILTVRMHWP